MPISPEDKARYPDDWPEISHRIRFERAAGRCECEGECGHDHGGRCEARHLPPHPVTNSKVVLTVAHRNHKPEEREDHELFAACQRCHLAYDREHHAATRRRKAEERKAAERAKVLRVAEVMAFAYECATGRAVRRIGGK